MSKSPVPGKVTFRLDMTSALVVLAQSGGLPTSNITAICGGICWPTPDSAPGISTGRCTPDAEVSVRRDGVLRSQPLAVVLKSSRASDTYRWGTVAVGTSYSAAGNSFAWRMPIPQALVDS